MAKKSATKLPKWATTVTPFSKLLALTMLIFLPILAFYYGRWYQKINDSQQSVVFQTESNASPTPTPLINQ